jgi:phosphoribosylformimino-5-aminoimidazole carboxamide ribotide isomerase
MTASFTLYPAIDILGGESVRLRKGEYDAKTVYGYPLDVAKRWLTSGASWLHIVDLDGAKAGFPVNDAIIADIVDLAAEYGAKVQVGGGIRTFEGMTSWLSVGVKRLVIGTKSQDIPFMQEAVLRFGSSAIVAGLDGRQGKLAVQGWLEQTQMSLEDLAKQLADVGVLHALVTDVERDGMLSGANRELASTVQAQGLAAMLSGGVRDVSELIAAKEAGLAGAILGMSLYDETINLRDALKLQTQGVQPPSSGLEEVAREC